MTDTAVPGAWDAYRKMAARPRAAVLDHEFGKLFDINLPSGTEGQITSDVVDATFLVKLVRPNVDPAFVADQLPFLRTYADLRLDRVAEIQGQTNDLLSYFGALSYLDSEAKKRTVELLQAVLRLVTILEMRMKLHFDFPRPITASASIQPIIQTPGHGSWPSGHATESFAVSIVLWSLMNVGSAVTAFDMVNDHEQPARLAQRIAANRTIAGVHYPTDSMAGAILGLTVGEMIVNFLEGANKTPARDFDGVNFSGDFDLATLANEMNGASDEDIIAVPSDILSSLWAVAKAEW
ncbi:MAG: phosphatase PAP2 family protein [Paracoccaceae bacterium]